MTQQGAIWSEWIDLNQLHFLSKGDTDFIKTMLEIYIEDFTKYLDALSEALEARDLEQVKYISHRMKSPASIVRVKRIHEMLDAFENAQTNQLDELQTKLSELKSTHEIVLQDLKTELHRIERAS